MSWIDDIWAMLTMHWEPGDEFSLSEVYSLEDTVKRQYPENTEVRAKIRQTLQELRDLGKIEFLDNAGRYRIADGAVVPAEALRQVLPEEIQAALNQFDTQLRDQSEWQGWEKRKSQRFALRHGGKLYPPKKIISLATGTPVGAFSGGVQSNGYLTRLGFDVISLDRPSTQWTPKWWVNQGTSYNTEREGGYLFAPKQTQAGVPLVYHTNVALLEVGDRIIHYARGKIRATSTVLRKSIESDRPGLSDDPRDKNGYLAAVRYEELPRAIPLEEVPADIRTLDAGGPFDVNGNVKVAYLIALSPLLQERLAEVIGTQPRIQEERADKRYWCIAPGEGARFWQEYLDQGIITIGWDNYGDLNQYPDQEAIAAAMRARRGDSKEPINNSLACFEFSREMKIGDIVLAKRGRTEILGAGVVMSDYEYRPERSEHHNVRRVKWTANGPWAVPESARLPMKTLTDVSKYDSLLSFLRPFVEGASGKPEPSVTPEYSVQDALKELFLSPQQFQDVLDVLATKKNVILEGAPGVGKTFVARRLAYALMRTKDVSRGNSPHRRLYDLICQGVMREFIEGAEGLLLD